MSYKKIGWEDYPSVKTPINAVNLNHMDEGIADLSKQIENIDKHTHKNKSVLDRITKIQIDNIEAVPALNWIRLQDIGIIDSLASRAHMHDNYDLLNWIKKGTFNDADPNVIEYLSSANILKRLYILEETVGILRSKNLLKNTVGTALQCGVQFTEWSDSVQCNGTATADTNYRFVLTLKENTDYILTGCPTGGSTSTYNLFAMDADTWTKIYRDIGNGKTFNTGSCTEWHIIIRIKSGYTADNLNFKPMLRSKNIFLNDSEYEAYTADDLQTQINELKIDSGWIRMMISSGNGELYYRKYGKMVELKGSVSPNGSDEWNVCTLPGGYRPSTTAVDVTVIGNSPRNLSISTQGIVTISDVIAHELIKVHACFLVD